MSKSKSRLLHYLLARQQRQARHEAFERAADAGILEHQQIGERLRDGSIWQLPENHAALFNGDKHHDCQVVQMTLEASGRSQDLQVGQHVDPDDEFAGQFDPITDFTDPVDQSQDETAKARRPKPGKRPRKSLTRPEVAARRDHVLSIVVGFAPGLKPEKVATALLLARAVGHDEQTLDRLISGMSRKWPIVAVQIPVHDFVRQFGLMLEEGLVLPFYTSLCSIRTGPTLSGRHKPLADSKCRKSIGTISGAYVRRTDEEDLRQIVSRNILALEKPVVLADEKQAPLPSRLTAVADVMIKGEGIDASLIAEVLALCCDICKSRSLFLMNEVGFEPVHLGIDDLAVAIRPGRSLTRIIGILIALEDENASNDEGEDDGGKSSDPRGSSKSSGTSAIERNRKKFDGCFDVIAPVNTGSAAAKPAKGSVTGSAAEAAAQGNGKDRLLVENLAGYGDARQWALDLKQDLVTWRNDVVDWSDLSSRLLLSGPPGTGKTTFARALCNTLQVPLVATSVSRWLEASHLGDVLAAMAATFQHANQAAPCILFIDEIDNIGSRSGGSQRHYDDYWSSLVNRLLELLDGASKTEGVIVVGATNCPEKIDAALLRSGRLEKHIMIPPPDTEALIGIIAHHLGSDLDAVLRSHAGNAMAGLLDATPSKLSLSGSIADDDAGTQNSQHHKGVPSHG